MLEEIATVTLFHFILLVCRIGAAFVSMSGFGEVYVVTRVRLLMAIAVSLALQPVLEPLLPPLPAGALEALLLIAGELLIGLFIGGITRILQGILHVAGMIIAFQSSLASALLFDANQGSQGSVVGNFLTLLGLTLIFATGLHHLLLKGVAHSYIAFKPGLMPPVADFAELATTVLSEGFMVAFMLSVPLIISGTLIYLGAGLLGRLMPNMQVFFVLIPVQVYVSFVLLAITLSAMLMWYINHYEAVMQVFLEG